MNDASRLIATAEAARILNVSPATLWRMANDGRIKAVILGGYRYYNPDDVRKLATARERALAAEAR
jgi:excisionase family DNA binding protein